VRLSVSSMALFSERRGLKEPKVALQIGSMDDDLRNGLWDCLSIRYFDNLRGQVFLKDTDVATIVYSIWHSYFKQPIDTIEEWSPKLYPVLRGYFFNAQWNEVYDFIEFVANCETGTRSKEFMEDCNRLLERELSGYRFVGGRITPISSKEEIAEIDSAIRTPLQPVSDHLQRALELFSDKKKPDYRNSIKESISAVEAICNLITNDKKTTLGKALDAIERQGKVVLHPALKKSFDSLYGYTSSADGIRHALLEESTLTPDDARFMLVSCSAFVNYLISKASDSGIKL